MKNQSKAYFFAITAILFWSTVATAFKISLQYLDFLHLLLYSSFISVIVIGIILAVQRKFAMVFQYTAKDYLKSALVGFLNPFLYYVVLLKAYSIIRAQEAITLNYTWPIMLVILSIFLLKQHITFKSIIAIFISFSGVMTIATRGNIFSLSFQNPFGTALALGSSVVWALFWIYNMKDERDETVKLFLNFIFGFIFTVITILIFSSFTLPPIKGLICTGYIGLFEMGITFVLWLNALKLSETTAKVSNLVFLSPFLSLFFVSIVIGEKILPSTIIGLILIVTGIVVQQYKYKGSKFKVQKFRG